MNPHFFPPPQNRVARLSILLVALALLGASLACGVISSIGPQVFFSQKTYQIEAIPASLQAGIAGPAVAPEKTSVYRVLGWDTNAFALSANMVWTPPPGATNFSFSPAPEPGGPPFRWNNRKGTVVVNFDLPALPPGRTNMMMADTLQVSPVDQPEVVSTATFYTLVERPPLANHVPGEEERALQWSDGALRATAPLTDTIPIWHVFLYYRVPEVVLTTDLCQDTTDLLRSEDAFIAVRFPKPTVPVTESIPLPLMYDPFFPSTFLLRDFDTAQNVISSTLEYRPERMTFAQNALPAATDEYWVTLGAAAAASTCPAGLNVAAGRWVARASFALDLSNLPDNCANCELLYYVCYAGQNEPLAALATTLAGAMSETYQGEGITCVGAGALQLTDSAGKWEFSGTPWAYISPTITTTVALHYAFRNIQEIPLQVTSIPFTATVEAGWQWYAGDNAEPYLDQPLAFPFTVDAQMNGTDLWLVGTLPAETADGAYTVQATAHTDAAPFTWVAASQIWVGDWVAPPLMLPPAAPLPVAPAEGTTVGQLATLSWQAGVGEIPLFFEVEVDGAVVTPLYSTTHTLTLALGAHTWRVRAVNDGGPSPWSPLRTFTTTILNDLYLPLVVR